jgi:hypothetical protein
MKKIMLGLFMLSVMIVNAQVETGKIFVGGSFGFSTTGGSDENTIGNTTIKTDVVSKSSFSILPQVGYMVNGNIGVGLGLGYKNKKTVTPDGINGPIEDYEQVEKSNSFVVSPFARYYKGVGDKLYLYSEFAIPIEIENNSRLMLNDNFDGTVDYDGVDKTTIFGFRLGLGADYFVSNNIALEANFKLFGLDYLFNKDTKTNNNGNGTITKRSYFRFDLDSDNIFNTGNISIGVKVFF